MVQFKYQKGQSLIATTIGGNETVVTIKRHYIVSNRPRYETEDGDSFFEGQLKDTPEHTMVMDLEGAERLADLQLKYDTLKNRSKSFQPISFSSPQYTVIELAMNAILLEMTTRMRFYTPR